MPSREDLFRTWQTLGPQVVAITLRFRYALLASLTPVQQRTIGLAIGENFLADTPDRDALVSRIDALLDGDQRAKVAKAMAAYFAEQSGLNVEANAYVEPSPPVRSASPSQAAGILASWLLAPQVRPAVITATFPDTHVIPPLMFHANDDEPRRRRLRAQLLAAFTVERRMRVAKVLGAGAVSPIADDAALAKQVDDILSDDERSQIIGAYAAFVAEQKAAMAQARARFREVAQRVSADGLLNIPMPALAESADDANAGAVTIKVLLGLPMIVPAEAS